MGPIDSSYDEKGDYALGLCRLSWLTCAQTRGSSPPRRLPRATRSGGGSARGPKWHDGAPCTGAQGRSVRCAAENSECWKVKQRRWQHLPRRRSRVMVPGAPDASGHDAHTPHMPSPLVRLAAGACLGPVCTPRVGNSPAVGKQYGCCKPVSRLGLLSPTRLARAAPGHCPYCKVAAFAGGKLITGAIRTRFLLTPRQTSPGLQEQPGAESALMHNGFTPRTVQTPKSHFIPNHSSALPVCLYMATY